MRKPAGDAGMTLIELLISLVILVLIVAPMTMVLQFALATANAGSHRTTDSAGAQLLSSYLVADVQGSTFVWSAAQPTPFTTAPFDTRCGDALTQLELQSKDELTGVINAATYDVIPATGGAGGGGETSFARRTWSISGGACTRTNSSTLVSALDGTSLPVVVCTPSCSKAKTVRMTVNARSENVHNSSVYTTFTFDLTATRRAT